MKTTTTDRYDAFAARAILLGQFGTGKRQRYVVFLASHDPSQLQNLELKYMYLEHAEEAAAEMRADLAAMLREAFDSDFERLGNYVGSKAFCPCCCEQERCLPDCTFAIDYPDGHAAMEEAREVLFGEAKRRERGK
jgi:hypothetical protein